MLLITATPTSAFTLSEDKLTFYLSNCNRLTAASCLVGGGITNRLFSIQGVTHCCTIIT